MSENNSRMDWHSSGGPPPQPHAYPYHPTHHHEGSQTPYGPPRHDVMRGGGGTPNYGPPGYPAIAPSGSFPPPDFWYDTPPSSSAGRYPHTAEYHPHDPRWIRSAYEPPPPPPEAYYARKPRTEIYANIHKEDEHEEPLEEEMDASSQQQQPDDQLTTPSLIVTTTTTNTNATELPSPPHQQQQATSNSPSHPPRASDEMPATPAVSNEEEDDEIPTTINTTTETPTTDHQETNGKKKGDSLSLLAKVSSQMAPPKNRKPEKAAVVVTSPNRTEGGPASPIQNRLRSSPIQTPKTRSVMPPLLSNPKPITPTSAHYYARPQPAPYEYNPQYAGVPRTYSGYESRSGSWEQSPALVEERNSFDSIDSAGRFLPPPPPEYYDAWRGAPPPYWDQRYASRGPPPPVPPPYAYGYAQPPPPPQAMEEQTILRKKFSWKHYPELERFLIDNRDEYLKYSSRNYTVEQKQFNNTLTERLISLAEKHGYIFDPEEFNFVAIRDRIRCYYKSYVQTARKRGIMLPSDKTKAEKERKLREDAALASVKE